MSCEPRAATIHAFALRMQSEGRPTPPGLAGVGTPTCSPELHHAAGQPLDFQRVAALEIVMHGGSHVGRDRIGESAALAA